MTKKSFIPNGDADFLHWHNQFYAALADLKAHFALTDAELEAVAADNRELNAKMAEADVAAARAKQANAVKTNTRDCWEQVNCPQ